MACLLVDLKALRQNLVRVQEACSRAGAELQVVLKESQLRPELVRALLAGSHVSRLGVSTFIPGGVPSLAPVERHQLYGMGDEAAAQLVAYEVVYIHSLRGAQALNRAAAAAQMCPQVMIMVESGDGREGVPPEEVPALVEALTRECLSLRLRGLATNFACMSTTPPTASTLHLLPRLCEALRRQSGIVLPELSVGGSDVLEWLEQESLPEGITEIRCGTALFLGVYPLSGRPLPGGIKNPVVLQAQVLECRFKEGQWRAILDFGRQHTDPEYLLPPDSGMRLVGASSGYCLYDVSACLSRPREGDYMSFLLDFHSLGRALAAPGLPLRFVSR